MKNQMMSAEKKTELPVGISLPNWVTAIVPPCSVMSGIFCAIEPLDPSAHVDDLYAALCDHKDESLWTYMAVGPFEHKASFINWIDSIAKSDDPVFYAIIDRTTGKASGVASYMRIKPEIGVIEIGNITFSPQLQKTSAATEALFLFMRRVFDELGYRRFEWKCDSLNAASRKAAERLGFSFDGLFEQAIVYKGRNRDTAWYSILDRNWPPLKHAYTKWLDPKNFDDRGMQRQKLGYFISSEIDRLI